ncbi:MAG TPA: hypothetical protein VGB22_07585 [candidate division Zixibacteria bacterium]|jgi:hypothetical protein
MTAFGIRSFHEFAAFRDADLLEYTRVGGVSRLVVTRKGLPKGDEIRHVLSVMAVQQSESGGRRLCSAVLLCLIVGIAVATPHHLAHEHADIRPIAGSQVEFTDEDHQHPIDDHERDAWRVRAQFVYIPVSDCALLEPPAESGLLRRLTDDESLGRRLLTGRPALRAPPSIA